MANLKLSQISAASSPPAATDQVVGVGGGTTDLLYSLSQVASTVLVTVGLTVGSTAIKSGTSGNFLYDNAGVIGERTPTQTTAALNLFTNSLQGLVPGSGGGTTNFLRADGTWAAPPGGGGSPGGSVGQAQWNNTTFAGSSGLTLNATLITGMTMGLGSDATGDIYYNNGSGQIARLGIGSGSQVLGVSGGKPSWVSQAVTSVSNIDGSLTISPTTGAVVASLNTNHANTWSAAQTFNNGDLLLAGSSSGSTTLEASAVASGVITFPAATDTVVLLAATQSLTNKTLASTTDTLGGVTMTLGSDATGDTYYRNSSGILTRLAAGTAGQLLGLNSGLPAWTNYGRTALSANTTYYVRTTPANVTISNASPAVVSWTSHGLSVNDPVVFCTPNNRTSGVTVTIASPGLFTWTAHGLSVGFPVQFNSTGQLPTGLTAGTTYYVTNNGAFTANAFNVSDTQAHALAGTNTINTSGSQSGTHWGNWAGVAPTGVTFGTIYYVISAGFGANSFEFSTSIGGSAVNTSSASVGQMEAQTGNDANPGTAQTRTGAWLTSAHAEAFLSANVDLAGFVLTIQYPAGYFDGINVRHQWYSSVGSYNNSLEASAYFVGVDQKGNTILQDNVPTNAGSIAINAFTDINQVQFFFNNIECRATLDACIHAAYDENANLTAMAHIGTPLTGAGGTIFYNGSGADKLINGAIIDDFANTNHVIVALGTAVKFWQLSGAVTGLQPTLQGNMTIWNQPNFSTAFIYVSNQAFGEYLIPVTGTTTGTLASSPTIYFVTEGSEFRHPGNSQTWTAFGLSAGSAPLPTSTQRHGRAYNYSDTPYSIQDIGTPVVKAGPLTLSNGLNSNIDWSSGDTGGMGVVYISGPTSAFSIGGWQKYLAGLNFKIYNTTSQTMTIVNSDASSTTNYQIHTTTGGNVAISGPGWAEFWYDNSVKRWILVNASQPAGSGGGGTPANPSGSIQYNSSGTFGAYGNTDGATFLQLGGADSATPTAQTLSTQNVLAGTSNTASPNLNYNGALSTGTGAAGLLNIDMSFAGSTQSGTTVTISIATPAVVTLSAHGFGFGQAVQFATTGSLPTGITAGTTYYVTPTGGNGGQSGSFQISTSLANCIAQTYVNTTGSQSGTQSVSSVNTAQNGPVPVLTVGPSSINGTGSSTLPALTITQHWNSSGNQNQKTVLLVNLDEQEAGNNGQFIIAAKTNGSYVFTVSDGGRANFGSQVQSSVGYTWSTGAGQGTLSAGSTYAQFDGASNATNLVITPLNWLTINNGTTAVGTFIYNTTDSKTSLGTNYERVALDWRTTTNVFTFGPQNGGTGTLRYMQQTTAFAGNPPTTKTSNYSQTLNDQSLIFNGTASITLTLLSAATYPGLTLWVRTIAGFTVVSASSNVIPLAGGSAGTAILAATAGKWALLVSDGTNWQIMASN